MALLFVLASGLVAALLVIWYLPDRRPAFAASGSDGRSRPPHELPGIRMLVRAWAPVLQRAMPELMRRQDRLLLLAGRPMSGISAAQLLALFLVYVAALSLLFGYFVLTGRSSVGNALLSLVPIAIGAIICWFFLFRIFFERRKRRLDQQFPYFLDFVLMMKEAGETLASSLRLYVVNNPGLELTEHMRRVVAGIETHKDGLSGALMEFHDECASDLGKTTLLSILKAEEMGARSSAMLRDIALDMRLKRYENAEKQAESLKSTSMYPAVFMFLGAFMMLLAGSLGQMFTGLRG